MASRTKRIQLTAGWASYLRTSDQEVQAPERSQGAQRRDIEKRLAVNYPTVRFCHEYVDNFSGTSADRKQYQQMLTDARLGKFTHVFAQIPDRFGRDDVEALRAIDELTKLGVIVRFALHPELDPANEDDRFYLNILFGMAKRESRVTARRTKGGMHSKLLSGGWPWWAPDGYVNKEIKLSELDESEQLKHARYKRWVELDPEQAQVWRYAWELLLSEQHSLREICEKLHARGYALKTGRPFIAMNAKGQPAPYIQKLSKAFRNWFYAGWVVVDNDWVVIRPKTVRGDWEPIVSTEDFERGLRLLAEPNHAPMPRKKHFYLLQGLLCVEYASGELHAMVSSTSNPSRKGGGTAYYRTFKSEFHFPCADVERQLTNQISAIQISPALLPRIRCAYLRDIARYTSTQQTEQLNLGMRLKKLEEKELNLWRAFTEQKIPSPIHLRLSHEYKEERSRLEHALAAVQREYDDSLDNLEAALQTFSKIAGLFAKLTPIQQRAILKLMIRSVILNSLGKITRLELQPPFSYIVNMATENGGEQGNMDCSVQNSFGVPGGNRTLAFGFGGRRSIR